MIVDLLSPLPLSNELQEINDIFLELYLVINPLFSNIRDGEFQISLNLDRKITSKPSFNCIKEILLNTNESSFKFGGPRSKILAENGLTLYPLANVSGITETFKLDKRKDGHIALLYISVLCFEYREFCLKVASDITPKEIKKLKADKDNAIKALKRLKEDVEKSSYYTKSAQEHRHFDRYEYYNFSLRVIYYKQKISFIDGLLNPIEPYIFDMYSTRDSKQSNIFLEQTKSFQVFLAAHLLNCFEGIEAKWKLIQNITFEILKSKKLLFYVYGNEEDWMEELFKEKISLDEILMKENSLQASTRSFRKKLNL